MTRQKALRSTANHVTGADDTDYQGTIGAIGPAHDKLVLTVVHARLDRSITEADWRTVEFAEQQIPRRSLTCAAVSRFAPGRGLRCMAPCARVGAHVILETDCVMRRC